MGEGTDAALPRGADRPAGGPRCGGDQRTRRGATEAIMYYMGAGPASGTLLYREACSPVAMVRGRDEPTVIGRAKCVGWTRGGEALWWLRIDRADMPGLWVTIDREFRPAR